MKGKSSILTKKDEKVAKFDLVWTKKTFFAFWSRLPKTSWQAVFVGKFRAEVFKHLCLISCWAGWGWLPLGKQVVIILPGLLEMANV